MSMFSKLANVRATLASCKAVNLEPATFAALEEAIADLDDAMVAEVRAMNYARDNPPSSLSDSFDVGHFAKDMLQTMNRVSVLS